MGSVSLGLPNLSDFDICPHLGFAASDVASLRHLDPYYRPWEDLFSQVSTLLASNRFRLEVRSLPLLKIDKLNSDAERRYAYLALAMLTQAYVFEVTDRPKSVVPANISEPFLGICAYWGLEPVLSHIGFCLWNWRVRDGWQPQNGRGSISAREMKELLLQDLQNVESHGSFTSTLDEKVFSMVPLLVEAEGGSMVSILIDALQGASVDDTHAVVTALKVCIKKLTAMSNHLQILHDQCNSQVFYDRLRPFIAGSQGMETKGLPHGFIFELSDGNRVPSKCVGASAGQSSLFQYLDHIFGIEHKSDFLQEMRSYMPRKHRQFLEVVEQLPNLRSFVQAHPGNKELQTMFEKCVAHLRAWRTRHIGLATRYVVMPARRQASQEGVKGTGGSLPIPFLKETRDETV